VLAAVWVEKFRGPTLTLIDHAGSAAAAPVTARQRADDEHLPGAAGVEGESICSYARPT
jgi:hypothetical protein